MISVKLTRMGHCGISTFNNDDRSEIGRYLNNTSGVVLFFFGYGVDEFELTELYPRFIGYALFDDIVEVLSEIVGSNQIHVLDGLIE